MYVQYTGGGSKIFQGWGFDWHLGAAESIWPAPKILQCENWKLIENCYARNSSNEVPVQSVCHNIHNLFQHF